MLKSIGAKTGVRKCLENEENKIGPFRKKDPMILQ